MSKGVQIVVGATVVALLLGVFAWSRVEDGASFAYFQTLAEFQAAGEPGQHARVHGYVALESIQRDLDARAVVVVVGAAVVVVDAVVVVGAVVLVLVVVVDGSVELIVSTAIVVDVAPVVVDDAGGAGAVLSAAPDDPGPPPQPATTVNATTGRIADGRTNRT